MDNIDWCSLLIGTGLGLFGTILLLILMWVAKWIRFTYHTWHYLGYYKIVNKTNPGTKYIRLSRKCGIGVIRLDIMTDGNGRAKGFLMLDNTWNFGTAHYCHTKKEKQHLSGKYDMHFVSEGMIHTRLDYLNYEDEAKIIKLNFKKCEKNEIKD